MSPKVKVRVRRTAQKVWNELHKLIDEVDDSILQAPKVNFGPSKRSRRRRWPEPLGDAARHGLLGEFLSLVMPSTEADEAALAAQFLAVFGNVVGRKPYFTVEETRHFMKLFVLIVGQTSKARKGVSWERVRSRFESVAPDWAETCIHSGLSSGEGLINAVRDPQRRTSKTKDGKFAVSTIPGATDKRLLVLEPEFASVLRVMRREGNTLSTLLRQAWDDVALQTLTKGDPMKATKSHISIVTHITETELRSRLTETDAANGFGNRFLMICAKRSKLLPWGGEIDVDLAQRFDERLEEAVVHGRSVGEMKLNFAARECWNELYVELAQERDGMYGALTARAEAQVLRLACLFALLDKASIVEPEHLDAARAFWTYADASAAYLYGDSLGDPVADTILAHLMERETGMTRSEIHGVFSKSKSAEQIQNALDRLYNRRLAVCATEPSGGRPLERWFALDTD